MIITQKQKNGEKQGRPGLIHHVSGRKVDVAGGADIQICTNSTQKMSFLPVKTSSFDHANIWTLEMQLSAWMDDPVH